MPEHHIEAGEMEEAEKVFGVVFPSGDESAEVMHPGEEPLHFPATAIAAQFASILGRAFAAAPVRCDQFDAVLALELFLERVRVVAFVTDEPGAGSSSSFAQIWREEDCCQRR